ncbi:MFS transporter [Tsukamurella paurometabola]|uniref:Multidrug resistance protein n=1 Tax=Tsukamurella paurometabola TaxID=2061 RepID=A0A3P8MBU4_TSUPA|nr:MFS transporter [Tsukamurella paurometabola]UEA84527.1 MFS transporter [Tsukamurella paurometabola]VDR37093.1 multidrug resistance protein [Tsukamurella paurometabola]
MSVDTEIEAVSTRDRVRRVQRRTLAVVMIAQVLGGAGLAAGVTVGALLAQEMLGSEALSGLPVAVFTFGSAGAAYLVGRISQRSGRRLGLASGFAAGAVGAGGVVLAAGIGNVPLLFASFVLYGAGTATNLQARYAGTDLAEPARRATAVSLALVSTTLGAVAGPNLVTPLGSLARALGLPALAGPFLLAGVAYAAAGVVLLVLLRPDPFLLARELGAVPGAGAGESAGTVRPAALLGAAVMVVTQIAMVAVMTMTPVHMAANSHGLGAVGMVIGLHIAGMYLPSPITGLLVDRIGRVPMVVASGTVLAAAGLVSALVPGESLAVNIVALVLLGVGWNIGLVAGTALVVDGTDPAVRARVQGRIDVLIAVAGAGGGLASGVVVAAWTYPALGLGVAALTAVALAAAVARWRPAG